YNNTAMYNADDGIYLFKSDNNTLVRNNASNNLNWGDGFYLEKSNNNTLTLNTAFNNSNHGIHLDRSDWNELYTNNATQSRIGVYLERADNNTLSGNTANSNTGTGIFNGTGILLERADNNRILNNIALNNTNDGIRLLDSSFNTINENNASTNLRQGITLAFGSKNNSLYHNVANDNQYSGISLFLGADNNTLDHNTVHNNTLDGIDMFRSDNNILTANTITNNQQVGIFLRNSDNNTISGNNNVSYNQNDGIRLVDSNYTKILGNTITYNAGNGINIDPSYGNTISGNNINNNSLSGVNITGSDNNEIFTNYIMYNTQNGINITNANNNTIYNNYFNNNLNFKTDGVSRNYWNWPIPIPAPSGSNIYGGPKLAGNYWADPNGTGFSQTALYDRGDGIVDHPYVIDSLNSDYYPLGGKPKPFVTPTVRTGTQIWTIMTFTLPYESKFVSSTIPKTMAPCNSYNVMLTVENIGTLNWSKQNGVILNASSTNGFTFNPKISPIPDGVVVHPGDSITFPLTINTPCPMKNGTYNLTFFMEFTVTSLTGVKTLVPFDEKYIYSVTIVNPSSTVGTTSQVKSATSKVIIPQNMEVVNTHSYLTSTAAGKDTLYRVNNPVAQVNTPVTTSFYQSANTLAKKFPLGSSLFWISLFQGE
ncbi:MAG: NosD domain-containing protein, partial [Methanomicrobiales archaeon]